MILLGILIFDYYNELIFPYVAYIVLYIVVGILTYKLTKFDPTDPLTKEHNLCKSQGTEFDVEKYEYSCIDCLTVCNKTSAH